MRLGCLGGVVAPDPLYTKLIGPSHGSSSVTHKPGDKPSKKKSIAAVARTEFWLSFYSNDTVYSSASSGCHSCTLFRVKDAHFTHHFRWTLPHVRPFDLHSLPVHKQGHLFPLATPSHRWREGDAVADRRIKECRIKERPSLSACSGLFAHTIMAVAGIAAAENAALATADTGVAGFIGTVGTAAGVGDGCGGGVTGGLCTGGGSSMLLGMKLMLGA